jgi:hypothetical protein
MRGLNSQLCMDSMRRVAKRSIVLRALSGAGILAGICRYAAHLVDNSQTIIHERAALSLKAPVGQLRPEPCCRFSRIFEKKRPISAKTL